VPGAIARLHPATKLAGLASAALVAAAARGDAPHTAALPAVGLALVALLARLEGRALWRTWWRRTMLALAPVATAAFVLNGLFFPDAERFVARLGPLAVSAEGLGFALVVVTRLALVVGATVLVAATTDAEAVAAALAERGVPHPLPLAVPLAGGLLPGLLRRASAIADAQRARGLALRRRGLPNPAALGALTVPLLAATLDEVEARTRTLEARGTTLPGPRAALARVPDGPRQRRIRRVLLAVAALVLGASRWPG